MKRKLCRVLAAAVCLLMAAVFIVIALAYTHPVRDKIYDLSLGWEGEAMPDHWTYDQKGWTVFTQDGDVKNILEPDGLGGFSSLDYPGQTFYFSRTLAENLHEPTLRLDAVNYGVAVFLDGELLYTDCFGAGGRIGSLSLPMLEQERLEPVTVTLPPEYMGKTLTVAQASSPYGGELQSGELRVWPCSAVLYCGYAYESRLIAECFQVALPVVVLFLMGVFLLGFFLWQVFHDRADIGLVCAAMAAFLWMTSRLAQTSFAYTFFGILPVDVVGLCRDLARTALLAFLASRCTGKRAVILGVWTGLQGSFTVIFAVSQIAGWYPGRLVSRPASFGLLSLAAALALGFLEWRREGSHFYRLFCLLTAGGVLVYAAATCLAPPLRHNFLKHSPYELPGYVILPLTFLMMAAAIIAGAAVGIRREMDRRIESKLLAQRHALAQAGYESMRKHQEQVMMLRHDIMKHLRLLRLMTGERYVADYLDEIMGENEKIRPVIQSGNEMLDIILNGQLTAAADAGIHIELVRTQAPPELPLSSMELSALFMNVMDNAVNAARASKTEPPYIRLDLHVKGDFFVFSCKNSVSWDQSPMRGRKDPLAQHGLGLKIIRRISERYGDLMETERGSDYYKVMIAIPLAKPAEGQPSK